MTNRVNSYFSKKMGYNFTDIDFHDFMQMIERGYTDEEIATELGISKEQVLKLRREV